MRIDVNSLFPTQISGEKATGKATSASKVGSDGPAEDRAVLSEDAVALQGLQEQVLQMPAVRQSVVDGLREQLRQDRYEVEPDKVADAIIAAHQQA